MAEGPELLGRRARYKSSLGELLSVVDLEFYGFSIKATKCLLLSSSAAFPDNLPDHLPTRVFIQQLFFQNPVAQKIHVKNSQKSTNLKLNTFHLFNP